MYLHRYWYNDAIDHFPNRQQYYYIHNIIYACTPNKNKHINIKRKSIRLINCSLSYHFFVILFNFYIRSLVTLALYIPKESMVNRIGRLNLGILTQLYTQCPTWTSDYYKFCLGYNDIYIYKRIKVLWESPHMTYTFGN